ncbi:MAG: hypothetical protein QXD95_07395 [Nitrososphaeria archaeon]
MALDAGIRVKYVAKYMSVHKTKLNISVSGEIFRNAIMGKAERIDIAIIPWLTFNIEIYFQSSNE